ncbi:MAG TPA: hypothetical protein VF263_20975 [Longimicrobiaceae bacterium]
MNMLKLLLGGAAVATILIAFRDFDNDGWLPPGGEGGGTALAGANAWDDEEPVLGFDGMDRDTAIQWLRDAALDPDTLIRIHEYEARHQGRERILETISEMLG